MASRNGTYIFYNPPGSWGRLFPTAIKTALNTEYSIISRMLDLEFIIELPEIQNITLEGISYWKGLAWK